LRAVSNRASAWRWIERAIHAAAVVDVDVDRRPTERWRLEIRARYARELVDQLHAEPGVQVRALELAKPEHQGFSSITP
jgi:hypothetical protein